MVENETEKKEEKKKTDPIERKDPVRTDTELEAHKALMEQMKAKKAELDEQEARIEKRNREFKEMAEELKMSGKSAAQSENSAEEKAKQDALNLIKGSGFEKRICL